MDPRGTPSLRLATETQPVEVIAILCRVSTTAAEDVTFNQPPIVDYTAAMPHDMITKSSKALYGRASKGRLSMWQFMPMEGAWDASWYYNSNVASQKKPMSNAEITALGSKPVQVRIFEEAGSNYALWLKEVANDQFG